MQTVYTPGSCRQSRGSFSSKGRRLQLKVTATYQPGVNKSTYKAAVPKFPLKGAPPNDKVANFITIKQNAGMTPMNFTPAQQGAFMVQGKTVVITGGSQGIGRATAVLFAKQGFNVVIAAREPARLHSVADECSIAAGRAGAILAVPTDVTDERQVRNLANTVLAKYESVDVLINCAGVTSRGAFVDTPFEEARRQIDVNYLGAYMVTQCLMPALLKNAQKRSSMDRPSIIMVNGFGGKLPLKYMAAHCASKFALTGLTESLRAELIPMNIHIGQVHPGAVRSSVMSRTEFYGAHSEENRKAISQALRLPMVVQTPSDVAYAIYDAAMTKKNEVMLGLPYATAASIYQATGLNVSALQVA